MCARKSPKKVTPEGVAEVKGFKAKYPDMNDEMIGRLCDFSKETVRRILSGAYDEAPAEREQAKGADVDMTLLHSQLNTIANRVSQVTELQRSIGGAEGESIKDLGDLMADLVNLVSLNTQALCVLGEIAALMQNPSFHADKAFASNRRDRFNGILKKAEGYADD